MGFRPEDIRLSREAKPGFKPIRVFVTEELGNENFIILDSGDGNRITARAPSDMVFSDDSQVWYDVDESKAHHFNSVTGERL